MPIQRLHTDVRMSQVVIHRNTVYLAGQVGEDMSAGVEQQTRETLDNVERLLRQAGTDKQHILSVTIYLKDIEADFAGMNAIWPPSKPNCASLKFSSNCRSLRRCRSNSICRRQSLHSI